MDNLGQQFMDNMGNTQKDYLNNGANNQNTTNNANTTGNNANTTGNNGTNGMMNNGNTTGTQVATDPTTGTETTDTASYWVLGIAIVVIIAIIIGALWSGNRGTNS